MGIEVGGRGLDHPPLGAMGGLNVGRESGPGFDKRAGGGVGPPPLWV